MSHRVIPSPTIPGGQMHVCVWLPSAAFMFTHTALWMQLPLFTLHSSISRTVQSAFSSTPGGGLTYPSHEHTYSCVTGFCRLGQHVVVSKGVFSQIH
eukprot:2677525-Rhodomonas_salina.6